MRFVTGAHGDAVPARPHQCVRQTAASVGHAHNREDTIPNNLIVLPTKGFTVKGDVAEAAQPRLVDHLTAGVGQWSATAHPQKTTLHVVDGVPDFGLGNPGGDRPIRTIVVLPDRIGVA